MSWKTRIAGIFVLSLMFVGVGCWKPSVDSANPGLAGRPDVLKDYWDIKHESTDASVNLAGGNVASCLDEECLDVSGLEYPVGQLTVEESNALSLALDDEYRTCAVHSAVIDRLGKVRPFIMIIRAEEQYVALLRGLFDKYGLEIPDNPYVGNVQAQETLGEACNFAVQLEEENIALYNDLLMPIIKDRPDIERAFSLLARASELRHLPAFQQCAD